MTERVLETPRTTTLRLDVADWPGQRAGQHLDVRLTAEDGYQAQRSYSIASPPGSDRLELTVTAVDDGEVSTHLANTAAVGDRFEVRGPIGEWFVWDGEHAAPVLLVGGGSGAVPLIAMMRHHRNLMSTTPMTLVYSARSCAEVIKRAELSALADSAHLRVELTLTREGGTTWTGRRGRINADLLASAGWPVAMKPHCYVCGSDPFVEAVSGALVDLGHDPGRIRTERFGSAGS